MRRLLPAKTSSFFEGLITRTSLLSSTPNCPSSSSDGGLPNARLVSHVFHTDDTTAEDNSATHMVTQMGQFLDHDITLTPEEHEENCCDGPVSSPSGSCFPIEIPADDSFYSAYNQKCLEFTKFHHIPPKHLLFYDDIVFYSTLLHEKKTKIGS